MSLSCCGSAWPGRMQCLSSRIKLTSTQIVSCGSDRPIRFKLPPQGKLPRRGGRFRVNQQKQRVDADASAMPGALQLLEAVWWTPLPPLHRAARKGRLTQVQELILADVDLDGVDHNGSTALMHAAEKKRARVVEVLVRAGASVTAANKWGFTPLLYAAKGGDSIASRRVLRLLMAAMKDDSTGIIPQEPDWMRMGSTDSTRLSLDGAEAGEMGDVTIDEWVEWAATRQAEAGETWRIMLDSTDDVSVGGQVIAGATGQMMGIYDGQRYKVERLFYRPAGDFRLGEPRIDVKVLSAEAPSQPPPEGRPGWELWAELSSDKWMPWGSTEVAVERWRLRSVGAELKGSALIAVGASVFWLLVLPAIVSFRFAYVPSESMAPTLHAGDLVLAEQHPGPLREGDILMFRPPPPLVRYAAQNGDRLSSRDFFLKRLVGPPGHTVRVLPSGQVLLDGVEQTGFMPVPACSTCKPPDYEIEDVEVPEGQLLVLGDNRGASADSHIWGFLPIEYVEGRVFWRVLPPQRFAPLGRSIVEAPPLKSTPELTQ